MHFSSKSWILYHINFTSFVFASIILAVPGTVSVVGSAPRSLGSQVRLPGQANIMPLRLVMVSFL